MDENFSGITEIDKAYLFRECFSLVIKIIKYFNIYTIIF
jgi:hypothetical protein